MRNKELLNRIGGGRSYKALVRVTLETSDTQAVIVFEQVIKEMYDVELSRRLPGKAAYILFVGVKDRSAFDHFIVYKLRPLVDVGQINSLIPRDGLRIYPPHPGCQNYANHQPEPIRRYHIS